MIVTTHTASSVSPIVPGPGVSYRVEGGGVAQLEVSADGGETWQGAAKPSLSNMPKFDHAATGNSESLWRWRVELPAGGEAVTTYLSGAEIIETVSVP